MAGRKESWSSPYKTRLWLSTLDHSMLNDRQKRLCYHFADWGPRGCDSWNYKLALEFHVCRRTIRRDLRLLKSYHLVQVIPGWAQLEGGRFVKPLRCRRIIALPWPSRAAWVAASVRNSLRLGVDKNVHLQQRLTKSKINQQRNTLFYGALSPELKAEASEAEAGLTYSQSPRGSTTSGSVEGKNTIDFIRKGCIEKLIAVGHSRDRAIALADIKLQKILAGENSERKKR